MLKTLVGTLGNVLKTKFARVVAGAHTVDFPWSFKLSVGLGLGIPTAQTLFLERDLSTKDKLKRIGGDVLLWGLTLGIKSPTRQLAAYSALQALPGMPDKARKFVQTNRSILESRTMAAVPFSYSNQSIDHAFATFQYSNQRLGEASQVLGNEAAIFAARYGRS